MLSLHHTLLLQSPEHHSWPSGKFDSCIELELLNLAVVVAAADAIPTLCPPTTVARTNSWPSAAAFFPRVGRAIDWLVLMRVMLYFPSRCLAPGLSRCLRRKFLATPSALDPRLSCCRCCHQVAQPRLAWRLFSAVYEMFRLCLLCDDESDC